MTVVLTGENDFSRTAELRKLTAGFVEKHGDFGLEQIEVGNAEFGRLLETVASLPFLATRRMVVLRDVSTNKALVEKIDELLDAVADTTDLVIVERKFDKRLSLYKTLKKRADFREFGVLDERSLAAWLVSEATGRGGELGRADATHLIHRVGDNQMMLSNELDKLLAYSSRITKDSIDLLTEQTPQGSVFDLLDAAFQGDKKRAMRLYEDQRKQQAEPQMIMGMIAWQVHVLAVAKFNEKDGAGAIASGAKMSPYTVNKALGLARKMSTAQVKELVQRALKLDVRLKSEQIDADDAVQHFLLTI